MCGTRSSKSDKEQRLMRETVGVYVQWLEKTSNGRENDERFFSKTDILPEQCLGQTSDGCQNDKTLVQD